MLKINRLVTPALAVAAAVSVASGIGFAQTKSGSSQPTAPAYGRMMGGWGPQGMMGYGGKGPGMMSQSDLGPWMTGSRGFGPQMCAAMASHVEGRLAYLKAELKITEAQQPLWKAYADSVRDNANGMEGRCTAMMNPDGAAALSLPDRLDLHEQFMATRLESMRATNKALKPLYAAFSDDQKKTAEQMFWGPMGMMGMM